VQDVVDAVTSEARSRPTDGDFVPPQPYLVPGLLESIDDLKRIYGEGMDVG
jgi:hypothetical protein